MSGLPRRNINSAIFAEMYIFIIQEFLCLCNKIEYQQILIHCTVLFFKYVENLF